jgi:molybdopterin molybdotransferase
MEDRSAMKSWEAALAEVLEKLAPLPTQRLSIASAQGRFLQETVHSTSDLPAFDLSMMDGYAVGPDAVAGSKLLVIGTTTAGDPPAERLLFGQARRIFTGAPVPERTTRILPQEDVESLHENCIIARTIPDSIFIRPRGSETRTGDAILAHGQRLDPPELAILAALGHCEPLVGSTAKVAHLVLGNELVEPSQSPQPGQIRDTNSILIRALIQETGAETVLQRRLADDPQVIRSAIDEAADISDLLLISGGASVGDHDHARSCLREVGFEFLFDKIRLRPGKPSAVGFRQNQAAICLPGNPVAHLTVFLLLVRPALAKLAGSANPCPTFFHAPLLQIMPDKPNSRHTFWPAMHRPEGLRPLRFSSSGDLLAMGGINAMISLEADTALPMVGSLVSFLSLRASI